MSKVQRERQPIRGSVSVYCGGARAKTENWAKWSAELRSSPLDPKGVAQVLTGREQDSREIPLKQSRDFGLGYSVMPALQAGNPYSVFLGLLICTDLAFIATDIMFPDCRLCSIGWDRGYPELFQYIKLFWGAMLLGVLAVTRFDFMYAGWSLLFVYLLTDDAFLIHERYGASFVAALSLQPMFGLRAQDFGELLVTGISALVLFTPLTIGYFRAKERERAFSRYLVAIVFALAFFGVFVDMLQIMAGNTQLGAVLGMVEDGGEMIVVSVMLWFVFRHGFEGKLKFSEGK